VIIDAENDNIYMKSFWNKNRIMTENETFKNMIENAYLQQRQMIETNASIMKNYSSISGNNEIAGNIEKVQSHFLTLNDEAKKSMLDQLDLIKDNFLSNAVKIKDGLKNTANIDTFRFNSDGSVGTTQESK
jgi:hypothetical protein